MYILPYCGTFTSSYLNKHTQFELHLLQSKVVGHLHK